MHDNPDLSPAVLGYNLARPGALASGSYSRTARRLAIFETIATIPIGPG